MKKINKWGSLILIAFLAFFLNINVTLAAQSVTPLGYPEKTGPAPAKRISPIELPIPQSNQEKGYLGLSGSGNFHLGQIKTQVLIIEVYSFYCPHCQRSASQINDLYRMMQGRPDIREKMKIIGIGVGNSDFEVDSYRDRYQVPFPLFPDLSMKISEKLGVKGTPTFIGLKNKGKGGQESFYFKEGGFDNTEKFLAEIIQQSGLNIGDRK